MITIESVRFAYQDTMVIQDVTLNLPGGKITAIVGPNGAGKSTLLKLMAGVLRPAAGRIRIQGHLLQQLNARERARLVGYLPQEFSTPFNFSVQEVVAMGRYPFTRPLEGIRPDDHAAIEQAMEVTDTLRFRHRLYNQLSGGEKQRVMLASVLAQQTPILLLDEPLHALDYAHQAQFMAVIQQENQQQGKTIVWVTHEVNLAARFSHHLIAMKDGQVVAQGAPRNVLQPEILMELFGLPMQIHWLTDDQPVIFWDLPQESRGAR